MMFSSYNFVNTAHSIKKVFILLITNIILAALRVFGYVFAHGKSTRSLTEVTVLSLFVDLTHGDVPASSSAESSVARPVALQRVPGQT